MTADKPTQNGSEDRGPARRPKGKALPSISEKDLSMLSTGAADEPIPPATVATGAPAAAAPSADAARPAPADAPPQAPAPRGGSSGDGRGYVAAMIVGAAALLLAVTTPIWNGWFTSYASQVHVIGLERLVQNVNGRLGELAGRVSDVPGRIAELAGRLTDVGGRVDELRLAALTIAAKDLRRAAQLPAAFDRELAVVASLARNDAELARPLAALAPAARSGAPTAEQLRADFDWFADRALVAGARAVVPGGGSAWITQAVAELAAFTVRIGNRMMIPAGGSMAATLRDAGADLEAGDLRGAIARLRELDGAAREAVRPWLDLAAMRVGIDDATAELTARVDQRVTAAARR